MAGTLVGFIMMFSSAMASLNVSDAATIKTIIISLSHGFTTGVITTLIGVVTSMLLKLQLVSLEVALDADNDESEESEES